MGHKLQTLYKRGSKGKKVHQWIIEVEGDQYRTIAGLVGGKQTTTKWKRAKPKNVGKKNATTGEEQALKEAQAKWDINMKTDYHDNPEDPLDPAKQKYYKPILSHKFAKSSHKLSGEIVTSPKMDGVRVIIKADGCYSRKGERFPALDFFSTELLRPFFEKHPHGILDGEAYNHKLFKNFNKIISLCKKRKPEEVAKHLDEIKANIYPHLFDVPVIGELDESAPFSHRWCYLVEEFSNKSLDPKYFVQHTFGDVGSVKKRHDAFVEQGYEGIMVRDYHAHYDNWPERSYTLQKLKDFHEEEYEIIDVLEGEGNRSGMAGKILLVTPDGEEFESTPMGDEDLFREMFLQKDKVIGKLATVKFTKLTADRNVPHHSNVKAIRDYE